MDNKTKTKYIFEESSATHHYVADAFVVRCVDNRFWKVLKHFIKNLGLKHIDPKSPAGGAKVFSSPMGEGDTEYFLRELAISIKLHHVKKAMLFTHHDCGAYGGFSKFADDTVKELEFHRAEHQKAAEVIKERFPDLEVETYFIDDKGIIQTS